MKQMIVALSVSFLAASAFAGTAAVKTVESIKNAPAVDNPLKTC